jgi:hypothetical protein
MLYKTFNHPAIILGELIKKCIPYVLINLAIKHPWPNNDRKKFLRHFVNTKPTLLKHHFPPTNSAQTFLSSMTEISLAVCYKNNFLPTNNILLEHSELKVIFEKLNQILEPAISRFIPLLS